MVPSLRPPDPAKPKVGQRHRVTSPGAWDRSGPPGKADL
jgi:hypothetical protein